ncbi:MAG: hypothetical protein ACP5SH_27270 [Syntrophobacteraceae bacterium]
MVTDETKRETIARAAILGVFFVCLVGLSALAAYQVARLKFSRQLAGKDLQIGAIRNSQKVLAGRNVELLGSLQRIEQEYGRLYAAQTQTGAAAPKQEQKAPAKQTEPAGPVVGPLWVGAGKVLTLFGGKLKIVLRQPAAGGTCRKGTVVGDIQSGTGREKLCLKTGMPANFAYGGEIYRIQLSGIAGQGDVYHYYFSISR